MTQNVVCVCIGLWRIGLEMCVGRRGEGRGWWAPPATSAANGQDGEGTQSRVRGHFSDIYLFSSDRQPDRMFYYFMKRTDDCAAKKECPCPLRKREKAAIGVALVHCVLMAVNLYFFVDFTLNDGWSRVYSTFGY